MDHYILGDRDEFLQHCSERIILVYQNLICGAKVTHDSFPLVISDSIGSVDEKRDWGSEGHSTNDNTRPETDHILRSESSFLLLNKALYLLQLLETNESLVTAMADWSSSELCFKGKAAEAGINITVLYTKLQKSPFLGLAKRNLTLCYCHCLYR